MNKYKSLGNTCLGILLTGTMAWAGSEKLSSELKTKNSGPDLDVIVQYKSVPTDTQHQSVGKRGGKLLDKMDLIKAGHYTVPAAALTTLANDPNVTFISPNRSLRGTMDIPAAAVNTAAAATQGLNEDTGIGVAVIDSGINGLSDFYDHAARIVYSQRSLRRRHTGRPVGPWHPRRRNHRIEWRQDRLHRHRLRW